MITDNYSDVLTAMAEFSQDFTFDSSNYLTILIVGLAIYAIMYGNMDQLNKIYDK